MRPNKILICCLLLCNFQKAFAMDFYVSESTGNDSNDGTSAAVPWKTIAKVNDSHIQGGDIVYFKRGDVWREHLITGSGDALHGFVTYDAYGSGQKPNLRLSVNKSKLTDWKMVGNNIWYTDNLPGNDIGNIFFDGDRAAGQKVFKVSDLTQDLDFWWDIDKKILELYSAENPASRFTSIECGYNLYYVIDLGNSNYVKVQNLDISNSGDHGIRGQKNDHIIIRNNDIHHLGGAAAHYPNHTRQGDGIEFWQEATNIWVYNNRLWQIYDVALSSQYNGKENVNHQNQFWFNNIVWKCSRAFEYFVFTAPSAVVNLDHIYLLNNTFLDMGGWGADNRPDKDAVRPIEIYPSAPLHDFYIMNNIFALTRQSLVYFGDKYPNQDYGMDYNLYWATNSNKSMWRLNHVSYSNFTDYQTSTGYDKHSLFTDPQLNSSMPFSLSSSSPAIAAGIDLGEMKIKDLWNQGCKIKSHNLGAYSCEL